MRIRTHRELDAYRMAFEAAMRAFEVSKRFPREETYSFPILNSRRRQLAPVRVGRPNSQESDSISRFGNVVRLTAGAVRVRERRGYAGE